MTPRRFAPFLAVLLLMQWAMAYGHCRVLQEASHPSTLDAFGSEICRAHDGNASGPDTPAHHGDWDCPACHHVAFLDTAAPPVLVGAPVVWVARASPPRRRVLATLGPRAPPPPARAPPTLA